MVYGLWFVVCGLWFVVCGLWLLPHHWAGIIKMSSYKFSVLEVWLPDFKEQ